ncbi:MAG: AMP-binding protein [Bacteroidota bacterium]
MLHPEKFHIDGISYSQTELIDFCQDAGEDTSKPVWKRDILSFIKLFLDPSEGDILQKTSGTTGDPREYLLHRESMIRSAQRTLDYFTLQPDDRALLCLPINYVAGKMMVVRALVGGLDLVTVEPSGRPLKDLDGSITFGAMVPLQVYESIQHGDDLSGIEKLIIGGGELSPSLIKKLGRMDSPEVYESFAMTETYTHFALKRINGTTPDDAFRLLDGIRIKQDKRGCLEVEIPGVTEGLVATNDLVEINSEGIGFKWLGRYDNVINSGGIKIIPEVLEQRIRDLLGHHCLVLSEGDAKLGDRLVLMVEYGDPNPPDDAWFELLHHKLSKFEVPKRIVTVGLIPRNLSFKPDRKAARRLL